MHHTAISRRSIAQGLAWSVPAVTLVAAAPSFAASNTQPTIVPTGMAGLQYFVSSLNTVGTHTLDASFGSVQVIDLPAGVTVTSITVTLYVQNRTQRTPWPDRGYPTPATSWVSHQTGPTSYQAGTTTTWWDAKNNWVNPNYKYNGISSFYDGRNTYSAWSITSTWKAGTAGEKRVGTLSDGTFTLPQMGSFYLTATDATPPSAGPDGNNIIAMSGVSVTVVLNNGETLSYTGPTDYPA